MIIQRSDLTEYALQLGVWESLCEIAEADPQCHDEIEITAAATVSQFSYGNEKDLSLNNYG